MEAVPIPLVRGPALHEAGLLLPAQRALARRARSLSGAPAIYDVLVWAIDELPPMLALPPSKGTKAAGWGQQRAPTKLEKPVEPAIAAAGAGPIEEDWERVKGYGPTEEAIAVGRNSSGGSGSNIGGGRAIRPRLSGAEPLWGSGQNENGGADRSRGGGGSHSGGSWRRGGGGVQGGRGRGGGDDSYGLERRNTQGRGDVERKPPGRPPVAVKRSREFERMRRQRDALPAAKARSEFLSMVRRSPVVLVSGETGCGKTTQIPQFLLEDWEEGAPTAAVAAGPGGGDGNLRVLVTQPRRIAAVGVAQRVADERCEGVGRGVGYKIRGESKSGPDTRLLFCTTGLLLRRMQGDPLLEEVSHLVVDEVHERHLDADFLLALLISILPKR